MARPGEAAGGRDDAGPPTGPAGGLVPELHRTVAAEQRAGHDGRPARAGTMPALRGGGREAGPRRAGGGLTISTSW